MDDFSKKIIKLKSEIDYQENAIVSKTITTNANSSLTLFSFDAGQSVSRHSVPVDAIVQNIEGEVLVTISGIDFELHEGDMIFVPKSEPHTLKAITKFKMVLFKV